MGFSPLRQRKQKASSTFPTSQWIKQQNARKNSKSIVLFWSLGKLQIILKLQWIKKNKAEVGIEHCLNSNPCKSMILLYSGKRREQYWGLIDFQKVCISLQLLELIHTFPRLVVVFNSWHSMDLRWNVRLRLPKSCWEQNLLNSLELPGPPRLW